MATIEKEKALAVVRQMVADGQVSQEVAEKYFPELKESERMVKFIKKQLFNIKKTITENYELDAKLTKAIDWLEKQVGQKPVDKAEPKFHEGEWVVYECGEETATLQITRIVGETYVFSDDSTLGVVDEDTLRLWDITKDAKDGDVLACESGWTCIFKTLVNNETFSSYCFMDKTKWFCETGSECHTLKEEFIKAYNGKIYPATKEQRDLLFQKMKEAGYEWDAEKKKLKEIEVNGEDYGIDSLYHAQRILEKTLGSVDGYQSDDGILEHKCAISAVKKLYEQKPAWSEEDENIINHLLAICAGAKRYRQFAGCLQEDITKYQTWLKSLRPQPKQEWNQNDIDMIEWLIRCCEKEHEELCNDKYGHQDIVSDLKRDCRKKWDWLEALKNKVAPQNQWKPSEEMLEALYRVIPENVMEKSEDEILLDKLYQGLKYGRVLSKN